MTEGLCREARPADIEALLPLVLQFYRHFGYEYVEPVKRLALAQVLVDPSLGRVWLVSLAGVTVGYVVVAFSFSMEYDGRTAFVDELFVTPSVRSRGLGAQLLEHVEAACRELGIHALHLETEVSNTRAAELYARNGYVDRGRHLMTKVLPPPAS